MRSTPFVELEAVWYDDLALRTALFAGGYFLEYTHDGSDGRYDAHT